MDIVTWAKKRHMPDTRRSAKLLQFAIMLFGASNYIAARILCQGGRNNLCKLIADRENISRSMAGQLIEILLKSEYGKVQYPDYKK